MTMSRNIYVDDYMDPSLVVSKRAEKYGYCNSCNLYGVIIPEAYLCRDCYLEKNQPVWELKQKLKLNIIKKDRLAHAWENEVKKRHDKGHAPISLRR